MGDEGNGGTAWSDSPCVGSDCLAKFKGPTFRHDLAMVTYKAARTTSRHRALFGRGLRTPIAREHPLRWPVSVERSLGSRGDRNAQ